MLADRGPAAACGSDNHINVRQVFENLDPDRSDTGDQFRFISRMHVPITFGLRDAFGLQTGFVEIAAMQTDFRSKVAHRLHF